jgi:histidinol dehydrogenase
MSAVPARVAGVPTLVVVTPPRRDGSVAPEILYAAARLDIDVVIRAGGAQAVAALAYGSESVPQVDKIVGPGNRFVVAAKRLVFGAVGIEALPGPTETLVLADESADPRHVAADLLAQAEHLGAQPVLVAWSETLIDDALRELDDALSDLPDPASARDSVETRGMALRVDGPEDAFEVANAYAPEHLCLLVEDPWRWLPRVRNAGGIFLGPHSMEALGDYVAGPSHVMPTGATARFASFVNVRDFQKVIPVLSLSAELVREIGPAAVRMARAEGLEAHARAVLSRLEPGD